MKYWNDYGGGNPRQTCLAERLLAVKQRCEQFARHATRYQKHWVESNRARLAAGGKLTALTISSVIFVATACIGNSQTLAPGRSTPTSVQSHFRAALDALSKRWGVAIIAEASPITESSSADVSPSKAHEDVAQAVERVSAAFDYSVVRQENVFVLKKKYSNREDTPDITAGEASDALGAICRFLQSFDPTFLKAPGPWSPRGLAISNVLSRDQLAALSNGGVPVRSLSSEQRSQVWRFALSFYIGDVLSEAKSARDLMLAIIKQAPVFRWGTAGGGNQEFGFETRFGDPPHVVFLPISNPLTVVAHTDGSVTRYGSFTVNGVQKEEVDPTEPGPTNSTEGHEVIEETNTISKTVEALNSRKSERTQCLVEQAYEMKTVTCSGLEYASTSRVALGLSEAYGLQVRHKHDGTIMISSPDTHAGGDIAAIRATLEAAIPEPIRRCIKARIRSATAVRPTLPMRPSVSRLDYMRASKDIFIESLRLVRNEAQPAVMKSKEKKVLLSQLSSRSTKELALSQSVQQFATALWTAQLSPPPYITDFDNIILTGGIHPDARGQRFSLYLSYMNKNEGEMYQGDGIANALIPTK